VNSDSFAAGRIRRVVGELDPVRFGAALLLVVHAFHGIDAVYCRIAVMSVLAVCLVAPQALLHPAAWWILVTTSAVALADQWAIADNHKFLLLYVTFALAQALTLELTQPSARSPAQLPTESPLREPEATSGPLTLLSRSSRYLLIFVFAASAAQKLFSASFLRGEVFEHLLLTDARMVGLATLLGIPVAIVGQNGDILSCARFAVPGDAAIALAGGTPLVAAAARAFTTADILLPVLAALGLLARGRFRSAGYAATAVFIAATYAIAPVYGFGWLLCVLGYWASAEERPRYAALFLATYALLILYHLPLEQIVAAYGS
jgi:hypothetical protein